jgi:hypothetical protein
MHALAHGAHPTSRRAQPQNGCARDKTEDQERARRSPQDTALRGGLPPCPAQDPPDGHDDSSPDERRTVKGIAWDASAFSRWFSVEKSTGAGTRPMAGAPAMRPPSR